MRHVDLITEQQQVNVSQQKRWNSLDSILHSSRISGVSGVIAYSANDKHLDTYLFTIWSWSSAHALASATRERERKWRRWVWKRLSGSQSLSEGQMHVLSRSWSVWILVCGRLGAFSLCVFALRSSTCPSIRYMQLKFTVLLLWIECCTTQIFVQSHALQNESVPPPAFSQQIENGSLLLKKDFSVQ